MSIIASGLFVRAPGSSPGVSTLRLHFRASRSAGLQPVHQRSSWTSFFLVLVHVTFRACFDRGKKPDGRGCRKRCPPVVSSFLGASSSSSRVR
ncbi:hypothetical protein OH77DRAFT_1010837 [Trametes cingulata]|nr:hypothetical protein OH77DRAFT_1010837 [Trametes cingulata]